MPVKHIFNKTPNGQVAGTKFYDVPALDVLRKYAEDTPITREVLTPTSPNNDAIKKFNVINTEATVAPSRTQAEKWLQSNMGKMGDMTGKSPNGIRSILNNVSDKVNTMPDSSVVAVNGGTSKLHDRYAKIAAKKFPDQFFKGTQGSNYIASPTLSPNWIKWLSRVLPGVAMPLAINNAANLYKDIQQYGPTGGYTKWLGLEQQNSL
jgi:hypothetical protein